MAQFMDVHSGFVGVTAEKLLAAHRADQAVERSEGVKFLTAWADPVSGKAFCLAEGPDIEAVKRVHALAGHPADEVYPVPIKVE